MHRGIQLVASKGRAFGGSPAVERFVADGGMHFHADFAFCLCVDKQIAIDPNGARQHTTESVRQRTYADEAVSLCFCESPAFSAKPL